MSQDVEHGHVTPGGPWLDRTDGRVRIRKRSVSQMDNNVYVVSCTATGRSLLVDPADDPAAIEAALADTTPVAGVVTHGHWDHVRAFEAVQAAGLPLLAHPEDAELLPAPADGDLEDGQVLTIGELEVTVLHVPGHTPGSVVLHVAGDERDHLCTGDTLFPGGPGNTFGSAEDHARIMDGLEAKVFSRFPDDTRVYPGHGDDTTLGAERPHLGEWRERGW